MTRKREKLQAYFAGLFDGEGSVGIYKYESTKSIRVVLHVTMTEPLGVMLLHREYPEATFYTKMPKAARKRQYVFELQGYHLHRFLTEIKPYSIVKREQVAVALSYLNHRRREQGKSFHHKSGCEHCEWFIKTMKDLKIPSNGVNSVNLWPKVSREYRAELADVEQDVQFMLERLEGVETRDRAPQPVEPTSAPEKDIVQAADEAA